jgi:hypothetical protein
MTTVETIDFDAVFADITARLELEREQRRKPGVVRLWDGDMNLRGTVHLENSGSFQEIENETGIGKLVLPAWHYMAKWLTKNKARAGRKGVIITVDKDGDRWGGFLDDLAQDKDEDGNRTVVAIFKHDYEHLKHIIAYSNPFLPPEIQFPRIWVLFSFDAVWALKTTLHVNIMRLETSLWALPDDPMDVSTWGSLDQSTWGMVVKPHAVGTNGPIPAIVHSRFKSMHDVSKRVCADGQLTWRCRRWLTGDPPPWPGAVVKHGCIVWDLVNNSGWNTETSFGGDLFSGLVRAFVPIVDGLNGGEEIVPDPTFPAEASVPGYKGTNKRAPGIILRDGDRTGITSSSFRYRPAGPVGVIVGGHSMPGVNELISAGIQAAGDLVAAALFVPPVGGVADALLKPFYTDVFLAFQKLKDHGRAADLGWSHLKEMLGDAGDRAYTLSAFIAVRAKLFATRETTSHTVMVQDGWGNLRMGDNGRGNATIGTRLGTTVKEWGDPGAVYVDRVTEKTLAWDRQTDPFWALNVGYREEEDPVAAAIEMIQEAASVAQELGMV